MNHMQMGYTMVMKHGSNFSRSRRACNGPPVPLHLPCFRQTPRHLRWKWRPRRGGTGRRVPGMLG